jgi:hypothetical protein
MLGFPVISTIAGVAHDFTFLSHYAAKRRNESGFTAFTFDW